MSPPVPRAAEWILTHLVQADAADVIAGDLREEFQLVVEARGRGLARLWYWRQVVVAVVLCRLRLRRTSIAGGDTQRRARLMARLLPDLRYSVRTLVKRPAFTVGAAGALALGIGLTTAVFSVTDAVLLRPLPYAGVNRLVTLQQTNPDNPDDVRISPATYLDWRDASHAFAATAAVRPWSFTFAATDDPVIWPAGLVSEGFFELLGVRPMLGRTFVPEDYRPGAERVVVVSHQLWRRQFGADPSIVGQQLRFDDVGAMTIVGVMGPDFRWLDRTQLLWGPYPMAEPLRQQRAATFVRAIARVRETSGLDTARAEATVLRGELTKQHPRFYRAIDLQVMPIAETLLGRVRKPILILFAAVALVALIACANVGTLLVARAAERRLEFGIRTAIGAGPRHLASQLLAETATLAAAGTAAGFLIAVGILRWVVVATPAAVPRLEDAAVNWRVFAFSAVAGALMTALVSVIPAVHLRRSDTAGALRAPGGGRAGGARMRETLVAAEVALTVLLLVGAGLLAHSFLRVTQVDPGFSAANVAVLETHVWSAFPKPDQQVQFAGDALQRIRRLPGVAAAGVVTAMPFLGSGSIEMEAAVTGSSVRDDGGSERRSAWLTIASDGYFEALGMKLREGRTFNASDRTGSLPVAVVTESFARHFVVGNAVGATVNVANQRTPTTLTIVGVVNDLRHTALENPGREEVFVPFAQSPFGSITLVARTTTDASAVLPSLKEAVRSLVPAQTFPTAATLDQLVDVTMLPRRFYLVLAGALASFAMFLATLGIYSLTAFMTVQRTREFGVRMALGGGRREILWLVLGHGMAAPLTGIVIGTAAALVAGRLLESYLFGVTATDPATFVAVSALAILVAFGAASVPALRATRTDPILALRHE